MLANERRQANMPAVTTRPKQEQTPRIWCGLVHKRFAESCALKAGNQRQTRQKICTCSEADERKPMHYKLYFDFGVLWYVFVWPLLFNFFSSLPCIRHLLSLSLSLCCFVHSSNSFFFQEMPRRDADAFVVIQLDRLAYALHHIYNISLVSWCQQCDDRLLCKLFNAQTQQTSSAMHNVQQITGRIPVHFLANRFQFFFSRIFGMCAGRSFLIAFIPTRHGS